MRQPDSRTSDDTGRGDDCVPPARHAPLRVWLMLFAILALAASVRLHRLEDVNFWFDETFSIRLSQFPVDELVSRSARDTHPPLFFLVLKVWTSVLGTSTWAARLLSLSWSLGTVALAFGFVYEALSRPHPTHRFSQRPGVGAGLAGILIALSPLHITWAHQVRMYAPVACLTVLSTWMLWRAVTSPDRAWRWMAYIVAELAGLYTHVTLTFVCAAHVLGLICLLIRPAVDSARASRSSMGQGGLLAVLGIGVAFTPWLIKMRSQFAQVQHDFWTRPFDFNWLSDALMKCFTVSEALVIEASWGLWIGQLLVVLLVGLALGRRSFDLLVAITAAVPFVALIAASMLGRNIITERYFISGQTMALIAIATLVSRIRWTTIRFPVICGLIVLQGYLTWNYFKWRDKAAVAPGVPGMIRMWEELRAPGEPLVFSTPMFYVTARVAAGEEPPFWVFGSVDRYPFFVGTAVLLDSDCVSATTIDAQSWESLWTCDYVGRERFLPPIELSDSWTLVAEQNIKEFNCELMLRRFQRRTPRNEDVTPSHKPPLEKPE